MSYARLQELKAYLGIAAATTTDDVLLQTMLDQAASAIDRHTGRSFEATTVTKYYSHDALEVATNTLWVDDDLLSVTTLTNGDSSSTTIPSTEYWLWPRNVSTYWGIRLKSDSDYIWEWDVDCFVSVAGTWGYTTVAPDDIRHACIRLAGYYYHQKDTGGYETTVFPEAGLLTVPLGMPADVELILKPYRRIVTMLGMV